MVTSVERKGTSLQNILQPRIIELAGPAGTGKTTLAKALCRRSDNITAGPEISFRKMEQLPTLLSGIPLILPYLSGQAAGSRRWTWDEIKFLVYLKKWPQVLDRQSTSTRGMILLDHGPIFKMAALHSFGPGWLRSSAAQAWWNALFQQWSCVIDLIIWLDAPDLLLETRINARNQKHPMKGKTDLELKHFMASYRASYQFVLSGLAAYRNLNLIHFDTSQAAVDAVAGDILSACALEMETK